MVNKDMSTSKTYRVARLLDKDLGEADHIWIVAKGFGQVDLSVSSILLGTAVRICEERAKGLDRKWVAGLATTSAKLSTVGEHDNVVHLTTSVLTQACSHWAVDSTITWAIRFSKGRDKTEATRARARKAKRVIGDGERARVRAEPQGK